MTKIPSIQFYPGDWMKDPELRSVSLEARGLWIDLLCMMSESDPRGYLQINGKAPSETQLARMVGCTEEEISRGLCELSGAGVFSRTKTGIIFSRRMVKDNHLIDVRRKCGKMGGNPAFVKGQENPYYKHNQDKQTDKQTDKQKITPSSSSSTSNIKEKIYKKEKIEFFENHFVNIPDGLIAKWREVAPGINIPDQIKQAELWLLANPEKRRSRYGAFLSNWMVRAQEKFIKYGGNGGKPNTYQRDNQRPAIPGYDEADEITRRRQERIRQAAAAGGAGGNAMADDVPDFPSGQPGRAEAFT